MKKELLLSRSRNRLKTQLSKIKLSKTNSWWIRWWPAWVNRIQWWWACLQLPSSSTKMPILHRSKLRSNTSCSKWQFIISLCNTSKLLTCRFRCSNKWWTKTDQRLHPLPRARVSLLVERILMRYQSCHHQIQWWEWCQVIYPTCKVQTWAVASGRINNSSCLSNPSCQWCILEQLKAPIFHLKTSRVKMMKNETVTPPLWAEAIT